jgi:hypothetical protein
VRRSDAKFCISVLLLALVFVGAQLHFCSDLASTNPGSHVCQVCATAGHAVLAPTLLVELTPAVCRLEVSCSQVVAPSLSFAITSSRAPPNI